ncbi:MAG: HNH endonuclease [Ruminococcaceae bacterium]|nr:HNH endonuclease [Oscillospiraceae bacterium]
MEKKLLLEHRDSVSKTPLFTCFVSYASPQGRNHYENEKTYTLQELISFRDTIILETAEKNSEAYRRKFERGKVTDSLRYDVLTRDGFRCKLCGREANDGVKLEVDHIVPISKGGKTTMSNLQTLCKECNRGKRDKYNECNVNNVGVLNS